MADDMRSTQSRPPYPALMTALATALMTALIVSITANPLSSSAQTPHAADDLLLIRYHTVSQHNPQGKPWDIQPSSGPDLYVKLYSRSGQEPLWTSHVRRDVTLNSGEAPRSTLLTPISRYTLKERLAHGDGLRLEVWDQDLMQDDLIAAFELSGAELLALKGKSRVLSSTSVQLSIAWQPQPKARDEISAPGELRVVQVKPAPKPKATNKRRQGDRETRDQTSREARTRASAHAAPHEYSTCVQAHQTPELTITFALDDVPGGGLAVLSSLRELASHYRERLTASQIKVTHCLEGADLTSRMGLGAGWVRVQDQTLKIDIHRSYLGRTLMRASDLRSLLIRKLCYRVLKLRSPVCRREIGGSIQ